MSGDLQASSFGDPTAQPPTPKRTPTSPIFENSLFQTPKQSNGQFDESTGWTPRFAEDYSVFNSTPGNLRGSRGAFLNFAPVTPFLSSIGDKRPLSTESIGLDVSPHANHFSSQHNDPVLPADSVRRLSSTSDHLNFTHENVESNTPTASQEKSTKKNRCKITPKDTLGQTATPPPSSRKGRKLAPKLRTDKMQNGDEYGQFDYPGSSQPLQLNSFVTQPSGDGFNYPMSAPATAPAEIGNKPFWGSEVDSSMDGMNMDNMSFAVNGSMEWSMDQAFQDVFPQQQQQNQEPQQNGSAYSLDLPDGLPNMTMSSPSQALFAPTYHPPPALADPFQDQSGVGVNPGILFSRPSSSNMEGSLMDSAPMQQRSFSMAAPQSANMEQEHSNSKSPIGGNIRRPATASQVGQKKKLGRPSKITPSKAGRPGLPRSFSEDKAKRPLIRPALPALAPGPRPVVHQSNVSPAKSIPSLPQQDSRPGRRTSPVKSHHRLSSLSSIPEVTRTGIRTSIKFIIDKNGRARTEIVDEEEILPSSSPSSSSHTRTKVRSPRKSIHNSSDDDSSTDDEPIIVEKRERRLSSFAYPSSRGSVSKQSSLHMSQGNFDDRTGGYPGFLGDSPEDMDSEAETVVMNDDESQSLGDAGDALRKVMQGRQKVGKKLKRAGSSRHRQLFGDTGRVASDSFQRGSTMMTPGSRIDARLSTPSSSGSRGSIHCLCNRSDTEIDGDDFLVECQHCETKQHGRCVNITEENMPPTYICRACCGIGNVNGNGRSSSAMMAPPSYRNPSPLAHKSFKSFR